MALRRSGGTRPRVTMRLHPAVMVFVTVWMTGDALGGMRGLSAVLRGQPIGLAKVAFPLVGVALTGIPFRP